MGKKINKMLKKASETGRYVYFMESGMRYVYPSEALRLSSGYPGFYFSADYYILVHEDHMGIKFIDDIKEDFVPVTDASIFGDAIIEENEYRQGIEKNLATMTKKKGARTKNIVYVDPGKHMFEKFEGYLKSGKIGDVTELDKNRYTGVRSAEVPTRVGDRIYDDDFPYIIAKEAGRSNYKYARELLKPYKAELAALWKKHKMYKKGKFAK